MKKAIKPLCIVLAIILIWVGLLLGYVANWGNLSVKHLIEKYDLLGYPQGGVVLMGSSSMQVWTTSERDLGPLQSVNMGIGGTVVDHWYPWIDTLVAPFSPDAVVIYIGANDLHNDHKNPTDVAENIKKLIDTVHVKLPNAKLYFVSIYTTGVHTSLMQDDKTVNSLIKTHCDTLSYLKYIDCATPLLDANGNVRNDVFLSDLVHLNEFGYTIWTEQIRNVLLSDLGGNS